MALQKILFISAALVLTLSKFSNSTPTAPELNSTAPSVANQTAPPGAHHVLRPPFNGSALNHDTQSAYVYCSSDSYCHSQAGYYSECYNGACICDVGYHSSNGQCVSTYCTFDSDCTFYQANTRCNVYFHSCVCDYDTYKNVFSQTCLYYNGGGGNAGEAIGFSFGGFIFLIIIISVCVICCRRRRDRIIRVVGPPAGARVQQQQPRAGPGFVQPQPGYYQQNPQGYQQSYQQQQQPAMPMPQPVAYQNPNYQQQQQQAPPPYNPAFAAAPASGYPPIGGKM